MHKLSILGVSGQAGSGKDTVANYLCSKYHFVKVALADPIKRFGFQVFYFSDEQLWGPSEFRNAVDPRYESDAMWMTAQHTLESKAPAYIEDLLGPEATETERTAALDALVHWFFWLQREYTGKLSPRIMLQTLGTEWGREAVKEDIWMDYLLRTARKLLHEDGNKTPWKYDETVGCIDMTAINAFLRQGGMMIPGVVVSDIRFENELKRVRKEGGTVMRILRPDTDANAATIGVAGHASEAHNYSFEDFDFLLNNHGTLMDLYNYVDAYVPMFQATHH